VEPYTEHKSHTLWSNEPHHLTYLVNNRLFVAGRKYAELLDELPVDQSETNRTVVSANGAAQPFVRRLSHTISVTTFRQTNARQDTACHEGVISIVTVRVL